MQKYLSQVKFDNFVCIILVAYTVRPTLVVSNNKFSYLLKLYMSICYKHIHTFYIDVATLNMKCMKINAL